MNKKNQNGFTLTEVVIVAAIIGIISAIALPAYQNHVRVTTRKAAVAEMMNLQQQLERQAAINNGAYPITADDEVGSCDAVSDLTVGGPPRYALSIVLNGINGNFARGYTITATPCEAGGQNEEACGTLRVTNTGETSSTGSGSCF